MEKEFFEGMNLAEDISDEDFQLIVEGWEKVQDQISKEEFISKFNEHKAEFEGASFFKDLDFVDMVVNPLMDDNTGKSDDIDTDPESFIKVNEFEDGQTYSIVGRIMDIYDVRTFSKKNDEEGKVRNAMLADETGKIKLVFWNDLTTLLDDVSEGDIVSITNVQCKNGYNNSLELQLGNKSEFKILNEGDEDYPDTSNYPLVGVMKKISEITDGDSFGIIGRITNISEVNSFTMNDGRERQNCNVYLADETGNTILVIWSEYLDVLDKIEVGDVIKLDNVACRKNSYNDANEISLKFNSTLTVLNEGDDDYPDIEGFPSFELSENKSIKINDLPFGNISVVVGRVLSISSPKIFRTRNGKDGKLCNVLIADDTDEITVTFWRENIKHLKHISEGDIVKFTDLDCKSGYNTEKSLSLRPRSLVRVIDEEDEYFPRNVEEFPSFEEEFTNIADIRHDADHPDETVSIIGRLIRVPAPHSYESNGKKGKVTSLEIQDATGKISYTLWNNDVKLIDSLELKEGDIVKILNEPSRERNGEISLSHWNGRICKAEGDYDIPEYEEKLIKIGEAQEMNDVSLIGIVSKVQDVIEFNRNDGSKGYVKSIEISDDTGNMRVTLWGDDTKKEISKGDIVKVIGGNIEYDDYSNGYRVNTNWNTELKINPNENSELISELKELAQNLGPIPITQVHEIEDDGEEVDVIGRLISINDIHKFQRDDGSEGCVRSGELADGSSPDGLVRVSFWDDKTKSEFKIGGAYLIENARTRMGMYAMEINVGKTTRFIEIPESEVSNLPSFEELEDSIYTTKTLEELDEDDTSIKVIVRILDIQEAREFQRQDGTKGLVGNMEVGDETGSMRVTLWDEKTNIPYSVGEAIKIQNPRVRFNSTYEVLELSVGNGTNILTPSVKESESIPDLKELQNNLYESKEIENLSEEDTNVRITGVFKDIYGQKLLIPKCPHCNNTLEPEDIDNEECSFCGNYIDEPNYLLMLPGRLEDETGEVQVTFFNNLVEELLGMKHDEIVELYEAEGGDLGALEGKVNDLEGLTLEILADVSFNEFDEDIRLRPKKIFNREY